MFPLSHRLHFPSGLCPWLLPAIPGGAGDGETDALGPAGASDRADTVAELPTWALQAPWQLFLLGRLLWS